MCVYVCPSIFTATSVEDAFEILWDSYRSFNILKNSLVLFNLIEFDVLESCGGFSEIL